MATVAVALASASATAPAALADTFCVSITGCDLMHTYGHLQPALAVASVTKGRSTVRIGPVTLDDGPFLASSSVDLVGAGVGQTILTNPPGTTEPVLSLTGEANETVSDLSIQLATSTGLFVPEGLVIYGGVAERLDISSPGPLNGSAFGAVAGLGATLRDSTVSVAPTDGSVAVVANGGAVVEGSTLTGSVGIASGSTGNPGPQSTNVGRYLQITARHPVEAAGSTLLLQSSLLRAPGPFSQAFTARGEEGTTESAAIEATNVTAIGDDSGGGVGIRAEAAQNEVPRLGDATVLLRNSILLDFDTPISRLGQGAAPGFNAGVANVGITHSLFDQTTQPVESGPGSVTATANLGGVDPSFVGPSDFHLRDDSPLIDAGDPAALPENDLDRQPRALDGDGDGVAAPDVGAYEHAAKPVATPPGDASQTATPPGDASQTAVDTTSPRLSGLSLSHRSFRTAAKTTGSASASKSPAGTAFRFALSERATVTITIDRAATGRRSGKSCVKATATNSSAHRCTRWLKAGPPLSIAGLAAGKRVVPFSGRLGKHRLQPHGYRATLSAVDPAGNRSIPHRLGFHVVS